MRVPLTIGDFLERADLVYGDRVALVDEPHAHGSLGAITYGDMYARARGMAAALEAMDVGPGDRVALVSPNSGRFLISYFGVSAYGRVLVPINFRLNPDEVAYIVEHSGAKVLLVDPELDEPLAAVRAPVRLVLDGSDDAELFAASGGVGRTGAVGRRRGRHLLHQLHVGHHGAARRVSSSPTAPAGSTPPASAGTRRCPTATCCCTPCPCSTATAGACPTR